MLGEAVNKAIRSIIADYRNEGKAEPCSILLIGRYGFDVRNLCKSPAFNYNEKTNDVFSVEYGTRVKLSYLTAHSSKGLSADNVIIINAKDETYGFPSKVDDDPVLNLVVCNDNSYNYAEERRLFYVALTRTKNRVYIVTPESRPSDFIKELLRDTEIYPKVQLVGNLKSDIINTGIGKYRCPICGYPMQLRMNKNYGLRLWICTNDQEVCGFMTNDRHGGTLSIKKCDWCNDGYLVVKKNNNNNNYFLGCTNYKNDGSGCSRLINHAQYAYWNNNKLGIEDKSACKPSFFKQPTQTPKATDLPPLVHIPTQRKGHPNEVYKTTIVQYTMGDRQFGVIADANGKIITNLQLLQELHIWRIEMARQFSTQPSVIISDKNIVELATHLPTTKQELLATYGMGERRVKRFGDQIIKFISEYLRTR